MRILVVFILFVIGSSYGQETEKHIYSDSSNLSNELIEPSQKVKDTIHSPIKAALLSLLPGAGQIYNHRAMPKGKKKAAWKVPIIYTGLGTTAYFAITNGIKAQQLKKEYVFRSKNGYPNLDAYTQYDDQNVLNLFESARNNRDLLIFAFVAVYGLNVVDAFAEAHFVSFDVSKDLSMSVLPVMHDFHTPGLAINFRFK